MINIQTLGKRFTLMTVAVRAGVTGIAMFGFLAKSSPLPPAPPPLLARDSCEAWTPPRARKGGRIGASGKTEQREQVSVWLSCQQTRVWLWVCGSGCLAVCGVE